LRERRGREGRAPLWQAIAAIAAVAAVVIPAALWLIDRAAPPASPSVPPPAVRLNVLPWNAAVPLAPAELPEPPPYAADEDGDNHCSGWEKWLYRLGAAFLQSQDVQVSAPAASPATVTAIRVKVFRKFRPEVVSAVICLNGGGGYEPTSVLFDLDRPHEPVELESESLPRPIEIPGGVFTVGAGRTEGMLLYPSNAKRYFYEWGLEFDVVVDRKKHTIPVGSREEPIRTWTGPMSAQVDYDFAEGRWVRE
jgi:hypothetical protein